MRQLLLSLFLVTLCAASAFAQPEEPSRFEGFVGYSLQRSDLNDRDGDARGTNNLAGFGFRNELRNKNGFNVAGTGFLSKQCGITVDFSGHFKSKDRVNLSGSNFGSLPTQLPASADVSVRSFNILAGPHVRFTNRSTVTPFVHALAGFQTNNVRYENKVCSTNRELKDDVSGFALALGGVDVAVSERVKIRAIQLDYLPAFLDDKKNFFGTGQRLEGGRADNVRLSVGVVFK